MTPPDGQSVLAQRLAFKAFEIEEPADVYFFRPLGFVLARGAALLSITPIQLTILSMFIGIAGGLVLYREDLGLLGFALLIIYSVFDSADGQLARLTDRVTELGRVLDGVGGYVTHAAIYISICAGVLQRGGSPSIMVLAALAVIANTVQAQMYDYHRHHYTAIVIKKFIPRDDPEKIGSSLMKELYRGYLVIQRKLNYRHVEVESLIAARSTAGSVREDDRIRYRECFCWPVHGWNLLGDNLRFAAIGVLACFDRIDLFFAFILVPMNLALIALWFWQRQADRKFLASTGMG